MKKVLLIPIIWVFLLIMLNFSTLYWIWEILYLNTKITTKFEIKDNELYMNWEINSKTYKQFTEILSKNPNIDTLVEEIVPWSLDDDTMIKLAYYVRENWLNTKLLSYSEIDSWWVDLFLAWVNRTMERWAQIWVHSWSDWIKEAKEYPEDAPAHEQNRKYIEDMLWVDDFYWFTIYAAWANDIKEMTEDEIVKYWLLTEPVIKMNSFWETIYFDPNDWKWKDNLWICNTCNIENWFLKNWLIKWSTNVKWEVKYFKLKNDLTENPSVKEVKDFFTEFYSADKNTYWTHVEVSDWIFKIIIAVNESWIDFLDYKWYLKSTYYVEEITN